MYRIRWGLLIAILMYLFWPALVWVYVFGPSRRVFLFPIAADLILLTGILISIKRKK